MTGPTYTGNISDISISSVTITSSVLPTGASTEATLSALNTKVTTTANGIKVDGSSATQPVSAASLPLPTGAATSANQSTANTSLSNIDTNTSTLSTKKYEIKNMAAITPSDVTTIDYDWMYVGGTMATDGTVAPVDVAVTLQDDSSATLYNVPNGAEYILDIKKILSTGTSAGANVVCGRIDRTS